MQGVAEAAAQQTNIGADTVTKILQSLGAMAQGGLQKNMPDSMIDTMMGAVAGGQASAGGIMGMVGKLLGRGDAKSGNGPDLSGLFSMLDENGDGSPFDDILKKFI